MMDFALEGHRWWSLIILDGYSRTMLAGAVAPTEASWVALTVLYTACQRYGLPAHFISDSGGAFISDAFEGVCTRLGIDHQTIVSTEGQSYMNLMETHFAQFLAVCSAQILAEELPFSSPLPSQSREKRRVS